MPIVPKISTGLSPGEPAAQSVPSPDNNGIDLGGILVTNEISVNVENAGGPSAGTEMAPMGVHSSARPAPTENETFADEMLEFTVSERRRRRGRYSSTR